MYNFIYLIETLNKKNDTKGIQYFIKLDKVK